jgi:hypothetical protein
MGIGKETPQDSTVHLFSLKNRHSRTFAFDYFADLAYMRFAAMDKGGEARMGKEKEILSGKSKRSKFNVPQQLGLKFQKAEKLPAPGGAFN